jgi:enterochelin esterase-like enzyme
MVMCIALALALQGQVLFADFVKSLKETPAAQRVAAVETYLKGRSTPIVEKDTLLTFVWFGHADSVYVNGALQGGWRSPEKMSVIRCGDSARAPGLFYRSYVVAPDARIEYKFVVDGTYQLDVSNTRTTPPGDFVNSEVTMPAFHMSPTWRHRENIPHGTIDSLEFASKDPTIKSRPIWIYLPPGYAGLKNLPVVYVHDGLTAMRFAFFADIADNLQADAKLPPVMFVFVPPVERDAEYVGLKTTAFISAFCDELVPLIDSRYHTATDPRRRGVMGISNGGHIALTTAIVRPDRFQLVAGQSSTISGILRTALTMRQQGTPLPPTMKVWIDVGTYDIVDGEYNFPVLNRAFSAELTRYGITHHFVEVHDGHDWANWRERVGDILCFFFSPPRINKDHINQQR